MWKTAHSTFQHSDQYYRVPELTNYSSKLKCSCGSLNKGCIKSPIRNRYQRSGQQIFNHHHFSKACQQNYSKYHNYLTNSRLNFLPMTTNLSENSTCYGNCFMESYCNHCSCLRYAKAPYLRKSKKTSLQSTNCQINNNCYSLKSRCCCHINNNCCPSKSRCCCQIQTSFTQCQNNTHTNYRKQDNTLSEITNKNYQTKTFSEEPVKATQTRVIIQKKQQCSNCLNNDKLTHKVQQSEGKLISAIQEMKLFIKQKFEQQQEQSEQSQSQSEEQTANDNVIRKTTIKKVRRIGDDSLPFDITAMPELQKILGQKKQQKQ